ncbi:hypothetical protein TrispH2_006137 [Trichoplax sp. H2]|nr:hypothetical protein TrispH2_006137 [Trichoplax sp. H2]|eukprot:RDD41728.1 hypothetical protein TrispH2_006137 [Trichoplax sp. H2]
MATSDIPILIFHFTLQIEGCFNSLIYGEQIRYVIFALDIAATKLSHLLEWLKGLETNGVEDEKVEEECQHNLTQFPDVSECRVSSSAGVESDDGNQKEFNKSTQFHQSSSQAHYGSHTDKTESTAQSPLADIKDHSSYSLSHSSDDRKETTSEKENRVETPTANIKAHSSHDYSTDDSKEAISKEEDRIQTPMANTKDHSSHDGSAIGNKEASSEEEDRVQTTRASIEAHSSPYDSRNDNKKNSSEEENRVQTPISNIRGYSSYHDSSNQNKEAEAFDISSVEKSDDGVSTIGTVTSSTCDDADYDVIGSDIQTATKQNSQDIQLKSEISDDYASEASDPSKKMITKDNDLKKISRKKHQSNKSVVNAKKRKWPYDDNGNEGSKRAKVDESTGMKKNKKKSSTFVFEDKKKPIISLPSIPIDYLLIAGAKDDMPLKLIQGIARGDAIKPKNRYYRINIEGQSLGRVPTSTQFKNMMIMMGSLREIENPSTLIAAIEFGFCYINRNDVVRKNLSHSEVITAANFLSCVNGLQYPSRGKSQAPNPNRRSIDFLFSPSFHPHFGHQIFNQIIRKRNLLDMESDQFAESTDEYLTFEVMMNNDSRNVYIFKQQQQSDSNDGKDLTNDHAIIEERPVNSWLAIHLARGSSADFDIKYHIFNIKRSACHIDCPLVINQLGQINEPIKIKKKFRKLVTNVKKVNTAYYQSSIKTCSKTGASSKFWDTAILTVQEITDYEDYNTKKGTFRHEKMTVKGKLELDVEDWFICNDEGLLTNAAKEFYKLGIEAANVCKLNKNDKGRKAKTC